MRAMRRELARVKLMIEGNHDLRRSKLSSTPRSGTMDVTANGPLAAALVAPAGGAPLVIHC